MDQSLQNPYATLAQVTLLCLMQRASDRIQFLLWSQDLNHKIPQHNRFKGVMDCFTRIPREEGSMAYFRGLRAVLFQIPLTLPMGALLPREGDNLEMKVKAISVLYYPLVLHPAEVIWVKMTTDYGKPAARLYPGIMKTSQFIFQAEGLRGFYRGAIPFTIMEFLSKVVIERENSMISMAQQYKNGNWNSIDLGIRFSIFCLIQSVLRLPICVIGSRMIIEPYHLYQKHHSMIENIKMVKNKFGIRGFFLGFSLESVNWVYDFWRVQNKINSNSF